jgi:hypothetical protein
MKVQKKDIYHGIALTQIVEFDEFKALNKADTKYGHYLVNTDRRVLVKYSSAQYGPWQFTFNQDHLNMINGDLRRKDQLYVVLVCGDATVCLLDEDEVQQLINVDSSASEWIRVDSRPGSQLRVRGSQANLNHKVPHNRFPDAIFG